MKTKLTPYQIHKLNATKKYLLDEKKSFKQKNLLKISSFFGFLVLFYHT